MSSRALSTFVNSALLAAACTLASGLAQAGPVDGGMPSVKVSSAGLDLGSASGARAMFKRLTAAAEGVCGVTAEFDAVHASSYRLCYKQTLGGAVRALNQPAVTQVYVAQYPRDAARFGVAAGGFVASR
ncbi:MAG TPA: UrcA family protein [Steroidobacteraceae bacterium]|nr:UrcA family protein [Steroidobacteraceae bacterium]